MTSAHGRALQVLAWSGPAQLAILLGGLLSVGLIPPPKPSASAEEIANFFRDNPNGIRLACVFVMIGWSFWGTFGGVVSAMIRRMEPGAPGLSYAAVACVGAGLVFLELIPLTWAVTAYRPNELDPDIIRLLNDFAWYFFAFSIPSFSCWWLIIAVAILIDKNDPPIYPRWLAYVNIWMAICATPAIIITMFKNGPFAWNGVAVFYLPIIVFSIWFVSMTAMTLRAISRLEWEPDGRQPRIDDGLYKAELTASAVHTAREVG